ncbi:hypothetical protein VNO77_19923 [Canavalia gladiata]|uniref:Uncharacterized protein n=1 Tax=Canavalia gladiata TaxID=3824 RepID=A0AAN9LP84_CANGL
MDVATIGPSEVPVVGPGQATIGALGGVCGEVAVDGSKLGDGARLNIVGTREVTTVARSAYALIALGSDTSGVGLASYPAGVGLENLSPRNLFRPKLTIRKVGSSSAPKPTQVAKETS